MVETAVKEFKKEQDGDQSDSEDESDSQLTETDALVEGQEGAQMAEQMGQLDAQHSSPEK